MPERDIAIGIDLGGTQVRAALVDLAGVIVCRAAVATDVAGGPKSIVGQMMQLCDGIGVNWHKQRITGVGVSAPGPLDSERAS